MAASSTSRSVSPTGGPQVVVAPVILVVGPEELLAERAVEAVDRLVLSERARLSLPTVRRALAEARMIGGEAA